MVLIVAACLLGFISNLSTILSNNSTQTHDLFRLYMIRSKLQGLEYIFIWMTEVWFNNKSKYEQRSVTLLHLLHQNRAFHPALNPGLSSF